MHYKNVGFEVLSYSEISVMTLFMLFLFACFFCRGREGVCFVSHGKSLTKSRSNLRCQEHKISFQSLLGLLPVVVTSAHTEISFVSRAITGEYLQCVLRHLCLTYL